jgi:iron complex outermembrane receptor protein
MSRFRFSAIVLACLACSDWARADDAFTNLQDVVVQSGRLAQKQFDAPAAISEIDNVTLRNSGTQVNLSDVVSQVPGVVAFNRNNYAQDIQISIRGFGARAAFGLGGIRLITDGIPAMTPDGQGQASSVSLTSVDRIEVLKGPLAQMYGNASGGVIQTFTREAGPEPEASLQLYDGSFGMHRSDTQISDRVGNVGLVADYSTFGTAGYRANSAASRELFNSVITSDLQPDTRLKVVVNSFKNDAQDPLGLTSAQLNANPAQAGTNAVLDGTRKSTTQNQVGIVLEHSFDADLSMQTHIYGGHRDNMQYQASATAGSATGTWVNLARQYQGLGLQINGKKQFDADVRMSWTAGFDKDSADENRQGGPTSYGVANMATASMTRNELDQSSNQDYFAQANWNLGERWTLVTGARHSQVSLDSVSYLSSYTPGRVSYSATTPVVGVTWHAQDDLNIYVNQGKGFETPTLVQTAYSLSPQRAVLSTFNSNLLAANSMQREIGAKWTPTPTTRADVSWFDITTENEIVSSISSGGKTVYANAAKTKRDGLEAALREQLTDHWRTLFSFTMMQAKYDLAFNSTAGTVSSGNVMPGIPTKQLFASLQWSEKGFAPLGQKPNQGLEATLDWVARSQLWADDLNQNSVAGYGLINAKIRERFTLGAARMEAFVGVDNLANRSYVGSVIVNQSSSGYFEPGLPRNYVVGVQGTVNF